jgi:hypothetical protein
MLGRSIGAQRAIPARDWTGPVRAPRAAAAGLVAGLIVVVVLLSAARALAGPYQPFGSFKVPTPRSVAVQAETGDVFVLDEGEHKIVKLDAEGTKIGEIDGGETPQKEFPVEFFPGGMAVDNACYYHALTGSECEAFDPSNGDVYAAVAVPAALGGGAVVDKFRPKTGEPDRYEYVGQLTSPGAGCPKEGAVPAGNLVGVAIDSNGNVYVIKLGFPSSNVDEFTSRCGDLPGSPLSTNGIAYGGAADGAGDLYVQNVSSEFTGESLAEFDGASEAWSAIDGAGSEAVAANPANGEVFVVDAAGGPHVSRYDVSGGVGTLLEEFGAGEISGGEAAGSAWVAYSPHGGGEIFVSDYATGEVHIYTEERPGKPVVTCERPVVPTPTTASLQCTVKNPGSQPVAWRFEYATAKEYAQGGSSSFKRAPEPAGSVAPGGEEPVAVEVRGLLPQTEYVYRLTASSGEGVGRGPAHGTLPFTTEPAVLGVTACSTLAAGGETATIEASFEPRGALTEYSLQYGTSLSYGSQTTLRSAGGAGAVSDTESLSGLEPNKTYDCRLAATRQIEGKPYTTYGENGMFQTGLVRPVVADEWAASVASTSAVLSASLGPNNTPTTYYVEYAEAAHYHAGSEESYKQGHRAPQAPSEDIPVGEDIAEHTQQLRIENLAPGSVYHYRMVAHNAAGTTTGPDETFATPPILEPTTGQITPTTATLTGTVEPEGSETTWTYEYGPTSAYTTQVTGQLPPSIQPQTVNATLENLAPNTTYHYRLWSTNAHGPSYSADGTFTTQPASPNTTPNYSRGPALTSPPAQPQLATLSLVFPEETNTQPAIQARTLTRAQKLAAALKACKRQVRDRRPNCEKLARKRYGGKPKKTKKTGK